MKEATAFRSFADLQDACLNGGYVPTLATYVHNTRFERARALADLLTAERIPFKILQPAPTI